MSSAARVSVASPWAPSRTRRAGDVAPYHVRHGRAALVAAVSSVSVFGTRMLRIRSFGKDRCGYDARNTGLRHNRSLPRCRDGNRRGGGSVVVADVLGRPRVRGVPVGVFAYAACRGRRALPCVWSWRGARGRGGRPRPPASCDRTTPRKRPPHPPYVWPPAGQHGARGGTKTRRGVLRLASARLHRHRNREAWLPRWNVKTLRPLRFSA